MHESEKWKWSRLVVSDPQQPHGLQSSRLLHPWDFPGKSTRVGCNCLLLSQTTYWLFESEVTQSCPTLCDPMYCSLPGSSLHEILQARVLEWVAISFSRGSSWPRDWTRLSHIPGRRFNLWATREAQILTIYWVLNKYKLFGVLRHCDRFYRKSPTYAAQWWNEVMYEKRL